MQNISTFEPVAFHDADDIFITDEKDVKDQDC